MKKLTFCLFLLVGGIHFCNAQVSAGIYRLSSGTFAAIGTNPDQKIFGEARVSTGWRVDLEATFGYNFIQSSDVNFYSGFHIGGRSGVYAGIPLGLLVKPFTSKDFGLVMEASPIFGSRENFRAGIGLKYTFR
jgi:hypothetical protein